MSFLRSRSVFWHMILAISVLLALTCAAAIGTTAFTITYIKDNRSRTYTWTPNNRANPPSYQLYFTPLNALDRSVKLELAAAAVTLVAMVGVVVLMIKNSFTVVVTGKSAARRLTWPPMVLALVLLIVCLQIPTLVVASYDRSKYGNITRYLSLCESARGAPSTSNCLPTAYYSIGRTVEGFSCSSYLSRRNFGVISPTDLETLKNGCHVSKAAYFLTIPLIVLPLILLSVTLIEMRRNNIRRFNNDSATAGTSEARHTSRDSDRTAVATAGAEPGKTANREAMLGYQSKTDTQLDGSPISEADSKDRRLSEMPADGHERRAELRSPADKVELPS